MRIAFILPRLANQGPIIVAKDIIDNLIDKVELIDVYYFDDTKEIDFACNVYKINFFDKIDFDKYDVVHSHMLRPDFYIWIHRNKKYTSTIFVSTLHQNIYDNLKGNYNSLVALIFEKLWLLFLKKQDIVVTLTNLMNNFYSDKTGLNIKTVYNGRNDNSENLIPLTNDEVGFINNLKFKIIGSHCLLTKRKGIDQIIKSLPILKDYALVLIGNGKELHNLKKLAEDLNVTDRCFFLGYKKNAVAYLKYFDIYVMSSYSEGFPLGLLEAGLNKVPVVCSDIPIFRELFTEKNVSFFELDNTDSIVNAIDFCFQNKEKLSSSIFNLIHEKYSVSVMAENYFKIYQNTI